MINLKVDLDDFENIGGRRRIYPYQILHIVRFYCLIGIKQGSKREQCDALIAHLDRTHPGKGQAQQKSKLTQSKQIAS